MLVAAVHEPPSNTILHLGQTRILFIMSIPSTISTTVWEILQSIKGNITAEIADKWQKQFVSEHA